MNYYEELGLPRSASAEEIHQAYRNLARLLHPDQQANETMRRLADVQMKRLNGIHQILTDPAERRKYDIGLREEESAAWPQPGSLAVCQARRFPLSCKGLDKGNAIWAISALIAVAATYAYVHTQASSPAQPVSRASGAPVDASNSKVVSARDGAAPRVARQRVSLPEANLQRGEMSAVSTEPDIRDEPPMVPEINLSPQVEPLAGLSVVALPSPISPRHSPEPAVPSLEGTWLYVPTAAASKDETLYPPEYIEAVITERNGLLRGRYRARYTVADRAIPAEVRFRFEGNAQNGSALLNWAGMGEARGEVRLRLVSEHALEINWTALELGRQMGLVSGTAVLTRQREQ